MLWQRLYRDAKQKKARQTKSRYQGGGRFPPFPDDSGFFSGAAATIVALVVLVFVVAVDRAVRKK